MKNQLILFKSSQALKFRQVLVVFLLLGYVSSNAQLLRRIELTKENNSEKLTDLLERIEKDYGIDFINTSPMVEAMAVGGISDPMSLKDYLDISLGSIGLDLYSPHDGVFLILNKEFQIKYGLHSGNYVIINEHTNGTFSGEIKDSETKEPLIGAQVTITNKATNQLYVTDINGHLDISILKGVYEVEIQYIGYKSSRFVLAFGNNVSEKGLDIKMFPEATELGTVTVTAEGPNENVNAALAGKDVLNIESIKSLPTFLGEVDPLKSLSALPGINSTGDLASGVNVRGGTTGQNLIIQDQAIIYNPTHLFGLFSGFNPDLVSRVEIFKGSGPAKYGGRISSVMDVKIRNGDAQQVLVNGGVGIISSRLGVEGPISRGKSSYIVSGRIAYPNWFLNATKNSNISRSTAGFHDFTGKIFTRVGINDFVTFSQYYSNDQFQLVGDSTYNWSSINSSVIWGHNFNSELYGSINLTRSDYSSQLTYDVPILGFGYSNGITSYKGNLELLWQANVSTEISSGVETNYSLINPGSLEPINSAANVLPIQLERQKALEIAPYIQARVEPHPKISIVGGVRISTMSRYGPGIIYRYDYQNSSGRLPLVDDSLSYENNKKIIRFKGIEPRFSIRFLINEQSSLKASYYRGYQYIHQVSNTASSSPQDYWIASGPNLEPQISDQVSFGYFLNSKKQLFEFSGELYYKVVENAIDYIEGVDVVLNKYLEGTLLQGHGHAYGLEFQLKKTGGDNTGWVSYTYSRSLRKFSSLNTIEQINGGDYYPSIYDQPHNLSVVFEKKIGERGTLSANFKYSTGRPITIPVAKYAHFGYLSRLSYSDRNEYRLPDYHRLDISYTIRDRNRLNRAYEGEWIFSLYNMYGRNNTYSIFFNRYGSAKKLSILGSIVPSISYNFKF